jgi:hypothetical protein
MKGKVIVLYVLNLYVLRYKAGTQNLFSFISLLNLITIYHLMECEYRLVLF